MQSTATTPDQYIAQLPTDRKEPMEQMRNTVKKNLPQGFQEIMQYGMLSYVVPHSLYPDGYHCKPSDPLPFLSIASQKNHIAVYHFGLYAMPSLLAWFVAEYPKHAKGKLDLGKSCIRFKNLQDIPFELIGMLAAKVSVEQWIETYKATLLPPALR